MPLSLDEPWLASIAPPRLSPRVYRAVAPLVPRKYLGLEYERAAAMRKVYREHEGELSRFHALADVGFAMLASGRSAEERRQACVWLTLFPSDDMVETLARVGLITKPCGL
jgi:hypothetical protein